MPILSYQLGTPGLTGVIPETIYIQTTDTVTQIEAAGYLNGLVQQGVALAPSMLAEVSSLTAGVTSASIYSLNFGAGNVITLTPIAVGGGGGVSSITAGAGLTATPNPITGVGTIAISNVGTAGTTNFVDSATLNALGQVTALTAYANSPVLNITSPGATLTITGATGGAPTIDIAPQGGVVAGAYTNANISVNAEGIITLVASGGGGGGGSVTSLTAGTGITLTPSPITVTGSIALTPVGTAGTTAFVDSLTLNASGQVSALTAYANSPVLNITSPGATLSITGATGGAPTIDIANVGPGAGTTNFVNAVTLNAKGQVTALTGYANTPHLNLTSTASSITVTNATTATPNVDLAVQGGVTPGAYTSSNLTVNSRGIITAVSNGSGGAGSILSTTLVLSGNTAINALVGSPAVIATAPAGSIPMFHSYTASFSGTAFSGGTMRIVVAINGSFIFTGNTGLLNTANQYENGYGGDALYSSAGLSGASLGIEMYPSTDPGGDGSSHLIITVYYSFVSLT